MRRLNAVGIKTMAAFAILIPSLNILMPISLLLKTRPNSFGDAPFGDDPLDPQSWVEIPRGAGAAPIATYQGQELRLPGDDERERAA